MPIYEYRCTKGHTLEVLQKMSDDPLTKCTTCGAPVQRVFHPVAVHFKGSGFYNTDYGKRSKGAEDGKSESKSGSDSKGDSNSSSKDKSSSKSDSNADGAKKPKAAADSKSGS